MSAMFLALLRSQGLPEPKTEWEFHHERSFRFDFFWPDHDLAMEVDGGVWTGGRHTRGNDTAGTIQDDAMQGV